MALLTKLLYGHGNIALDRCMRARKQQQVWVSWIEIWPTRSFIGRAGNVRPILRTNANRKGVERTTQQRETRKHTSFDIAER